MDELLFSFTAMIERESERGGAYVRCPFDLREETGRGRAKVEAHFDGIPYRGSIVNMGLQHPDGRTCYLIGVRKDIQATLGKGPGDMVSVTVKILL